MHSFKKFFIPTATFALLSYVATAQTEAPAPAASGGSSYDFARFVMVVVALFLAIIILTLAASIRAAADTNIEKQKEARKQKAAIVTILALLMSAPAIAQNETAAAVAGTTSKFTLPTDIYILLAVILLELVVVIACLVTIYRLLGLKNQKKVALEKAGVKQRTFFQKLNNTVALEEEDQLDLQHDYDGIRELDNKIPGWWQLAFYGTILFSIIYLYRMFISGTMPDQFAELQRDQELAAIKQAAYLKNSANNVDENTVVMLDASGIASGADIFSKNCVACHGDKGQGNAVGPNLTDDFWLHKGSIKDVFVTIKYGVPEKGMRSWKDDFSPVQIAQLSSFIKSLHGTNPPGAKEAQGDRYEEGSGAGAAPADSTSGATPSDSAADPVN